MMGDNGNSEFQNNEIIKKAQKAKGSMMNEFNYLVISSGRELGVPVVISLQDIAVTAPLHGAPPAPAGGGRGPAQEPHGHAQVHCGGVR